MLVRRLWLFILIAIGPIICPAAVEPVPTRVMGAQMSLKDHENSIWSSAVHGSEFAAMTHPASWHECEAVQPPEALATPDPLIDGTDLNAKVSVSFIIGTDGRVHSALILESAGPSEDRTVLNVVRFWRYRPARCNGVPTEAEAKVEFSGRQ